MFDYKNYHNFILIKPIPGSWSFVSYDDSDGKSYRAIRGVDDQGKDRGFVVTFSSKERIYRFKKNQKVSVRKDGKLTEMKLYEYVKGHPMCLDGYNFGGVALFKEVEPERDAKMVLDAKKLRNQAETTALTLKGKELKDMAVMLGEFSENQDLQMRAVLEFAGNDPGVFLKMLDDPQHEIKALVKKALKAGLLKKEKSTVLWEKEVLGSEDAAVEWLSNNKEKLTILKKETDKIK